MPNAGRGEGLARPRPRLDVKEGEMTWPEKWKAQMRPALKAEIETELRPKVLARLEAELRPKILARLEAELRPKISERLREESLAAQRDQ